MKRKRRKYNQYMIPKTKPSIRKLPKLSAKLLRDHGFCNDEQFIKGFNVRGQYVLVVNSNIGIELFTLAEIGPLVQSVYYGDCLSGSVVRPYFTCPITHRLCTAIYFDGNFWASRAGHGIRAAAKDKQTGKRFTRIRDTIIGNEHRGPARQRKRKAAISKVEKELARLGIVPNNWWSLGPALEAEAANKRLKRARLSRRSKVDMAALNFAVLHGRDGTSEEVDKLYAAPESDLRELTRAGAARPWACVETQPSIDLKTLMARERLQETRVTATHLGWHRNYTDGWGVFMVGDFYDLAAPRLLLEMTDLSGRKIVQKVQVIGRPGMPGRWFLQCPVRQTLHTALYIRDGYFASAAAQRLRYSSQLPSG